ncbi:hypothetical protein [Burkholderia sp. BE17]|uniref:hypothetical protein n=1 Tax=Burkholderia sp. BE17 TaxID=2656644 RepID=UPI00128BE74B|nr:hypothetical protein [Burkholderia sp. BE17]MPV70206.1 hypothetical protein [Burkholderia sp. BE17]
MAFDSPSGLASAEAGATKATRQRRDPLDCPPFGVAFGGNAPSTVAAAPSDRAPAALPTLPHASQRMPAGSASQAAQADSAGPREFRIDYRFASWSGHPDVVLAFDRGDPRRPLSVRSDQDWAAAVVRQRVGQLTFEAGVDPTRQAGDESQESRPWSREADEEES